jgi:hypothetical protein
MFNRIGVHDLSKTVPAEERQDLGVLLHGLAHGGVWQVGDGSLDKRCGFI